MSDNKNNADGRDRSKVSGTEDYELSYLEDKLNVSREEVQKAIVAVGNDCDKVEAYLMSKNAG